jgi:hypothetical protein
VSTRNASVMRSQELNAEYAEDAEERGQKNKTDKLICLRYSV